MSKEMNSKHVLEIVIDGDNWTSTLDKAFKKVVKRVKIDGFRKGIVPRAVFEKKYGNTDIYQEAIEMSYNEAYMKALDDSKLEPYVKPSIDIKEVNDDKVVFEITIITKPIVELGNYKNLDIKKDDVTVTDEEVETEMNKVLEKYAELIIKEEGLLETSDTAIIDFEGFKDGVPFEGGKATNYSLVIGSNTFIPGFEDSLIGMGINSTKDIKLTFPEDYMSDELKGQDVVFTVTLNEIKKRQLPSLDEEFFKDLGIKDVTNKNEFKEYVLEKLKKARENDAYLKYTDKQIEEVANNSKVEIPEEIVLDEVEVMLSDFEERLKKQNLSLEDYIKFTNATIESIKEEMKVEASKRVKYRLIIDAIIEKEKVDITEEEVDAEINKIASQYNVTFDEVKEAYGNDSMLKYDLKVRKVFDLFK